PYDLEGRPLYPYWPVSFSMLDLPPPPEAPAGNVDDGDYDDRYQAYTAAEVAAVDHHFPRRHNNRSPERAFAGSPIQAWWQHSIQRSRDLAKASRDGQGGLSLWRMKLGQARANGGK